VNPHYNRVLDCGVHRVAAGTLPRAAAQARTPGTTGQRTHSPTMLDAQREPKGPALSATLDRDSLRVRIASLGREIGQTESKRLLALIAEAGRPMESLRDALSTGLMEVFRQRSSRAAFGLLYELNSQHLETQVAGCLRRYGSRTDPRDVLQEVFFNVYRYPHRFNSEREDAFRVWSAMIVRNTVLKHLRSQGRSGRSEVPFEDLSDQPEERSTGPLGGAIEGESSRECGRVYLTYLHLYLRFYSMLSERERRAIHLVEVEEQSYREAAALLGIKLENLKMVIFRARRKIHRAMRRVFEGLPPDCRPARDPGALIGAADARGGSVTDRSSSTSRLAGAAEESHSAGSGSAGPHARHGEGNEAGS
jgi:RNA polymerase sigma factor (sigma-70 family)